MSPFTPSWDSLKHPILIDTDVSYWAPQLYYKWKNGTYTAIQGDGLVTYWWVKLIIPFRAGWSSEIEGRAMLHCADRRLGSTPVIRPTRNSQLSQTISGCWVATRPETNSTRILRRTRL